MKVKASLIYNLLTWHRNKDEVSVSHPAKSLEASLAPDKNVTSKHIQNHKKQLVA